MADLSVLNANITSLGAAVNALDTDVQALLAKPSTDQPAIDAAATAVATATTSVTALDATIKTALGS